MAAAEFKETMSVDLGKLWDVITRYEDYPKFVEHCRETKVTREPGAPQAKVDYFVQVMGTDVRYSITITEQKDQGKVSWTLLESGFFKKNSGGWELKSLSPGRTEVRYWLDMEFIVPVPGFILSRLVKGSLPSMVKSFVKRAGA